jgi:hypothetical protein
MEDINKINQIFNLDNYDKIDKKFTDLNNILKKYNRDIFDILKSGLNKFENIKNCILSEPPITNSKNSTTEKFKFDFTKRVGFKNNRYLINKDNYCYDKVGTSEGNEICINFYPVGRSSSNNIYEEYEIFFGLKCLNKFPSNKAFEQRKKLIKDFFQEQLDKGSYIIIMGENIWENIRNIFKEINLELKSDNYGKDKKKRIMFNKSKNIYLLYHPACRNYEYKPAIEDIPDILNL